MEVVNPKTLTDKVTSVISHVVVTTASKLAFISGQIKPQPGIDFDYF